MKNIITFTLAIPLLLIAPVGVSGCATTQMAGQQTDDARIAMRVSRRLAMDPETDKIDIDVDVLGGVVTLRGRADDQRSMDEAVQIARRTDGVEEVINKLKIVPDEEEGDDDGGRSDLGIRASVGTKILADPDVRRVNIDVDVQDGVVTLSGIVHDEVAKQAAEDIATHVEGVVSVNNELTVDPDDNRWSEDSQASPDKAPVTKPGEGGEQTGEEMAGEEMAGEEKTAGEKTGQKK